MNSPHGSLTSYPAALELLLAAAVPLAPVSMAPARARGCVVAAQVKSTVDLPPFANSSMDGYAVRSAELAGAGPGRPVRLPVCATVRAGAPAGNFEQGTCVDIATGAMLPPGADAIVPLEEVVREGEVVTFTAPVEEGGFVRGVASDVARGAPVIAAGEVLTPARMAAAAACGTATVDVIPRPQLALIVTGDELRAPGDELAPGEIYDANASLLTALAADAGCDVVHAVQLPDRGPETLAGLVEAAGLADVVVTAGGVSMGERDMVRTSALELGAQELFWKVAVQPGKPLFAARLQQALLLSLPGNPVSCLVSWTLFVLPVLRALSGLPVAPPGTARLESDVARNPRRMKAVRCTSQRAPDGSVRLTSISAQLSHQIAAMVAADSLALVDAGDGVQQAGTCVSWIELPGALRPG